MYEERLYRKFVNPHGLVSFTVIENETDLHVLAEKNIESETKKYVNLYRQQIINYIKNNPQFQKSLVPIEVDNEAAVIVKHMAWAAKMAQVGPMAAVAGAISQYVGNSLLNISNELIIENGGDIYINSSKEKKVLIYAGNSPFSNKLALKIRKEKLPIGICTSAGKVGHSLSFGNADAVVIVSKDTLLADAVATAVGNKVKSITDIDSAIGFGKSIKGVEGIIIIVEDKLAIWGDIELTDIN